MIDRINTKEQHQEVLKRIEELMDLNPDHDTKEGCELRFLAAICEAYEKITPLKEENLSLSLQVNKLREALENMIDPEPCRLDHYGFCQAHCCSKPCINKEAQEALSESPSPKDIGKYLKHLDSCSNFSFSKQCDCGLWEFLYL